MMSNMHGRLCLLGDPPIRLYGLLLADWQKRAWGRAGVDKVAGVVVASADWVLSTGLSMAVVAKPGAALVERTATGRRLIAAHAEDAAASDAIEALMMKPDVGDAEIEALDLTPGDAVALAGAYNKELRKRETPFAISIENDGLAAAEAALFKSSYKGVTDLVTKYAWPVPAFAATKFCAARRISPNAVTTVSLVFVFLAMFFFWRGDWALGIACGWLMTFLDTVDGKLARTTLTSSKWGNVYDHGIDLIHPPFWYWAWYEGVARGGPDAPEWLAPAMGVILIGYVYGRAVEGAFMHTHGFHIHVWGRSDSFMRVITARRNPNMLIFMIFCIFGAPVAGIGAVAIWTALCVSFHTVRLFQAGVRPANPPLTSWMAE